MYCDVDPASLADKTVKEAEELISSVYAKARQRKQADLATQLGTIWANPTARMAILGGGVGAGLAGISGLRSKERRKHTPGNMMTGALAGGLVGGSIPIVQNYARTGTLDTALPGTDTPDVKPFTLPFKGQDYEIPPEALDKMPSALTGDIGGRIVDTIKGYPKNHPLLTAIGGLDLAAGAANVMDPVPSMNPEGVRRVLRNFIKKDTGLLAGQGFDSAMISQHLKNNASLRRYLADAMQGKDIVIPGFGKDSVPLPVSAEQFLERLREVGGTSRLGPQRFTQMIHRTPGLGWLSKRLGPMAGTGYELVADPTRVQAIDDQIQALQRMSNNISSSGAQQSAQVMAEFLKAEEALKNQKIHFINNPAMTLQPTKGFMGPILRTLSGGSTIGRLKPMLRTPFRLGARGILYGAYPILTALLRQRGSSPADQATIADFIKRFGKPA